MFEHWVTTTTPEHAYPISFGAGQLKIENQNPDITFKNVNTVTSTWLLVFLEHLN